MDSDDDRKRRALLRAAFEALAALDRVIPSEGYESEGAAVDSAVEELRDGFGHDVAPNCEACSAIVLFGETGHTCREGEVLCANCAPTWADIRDQWEEGSLEEDEPGERNKFLANLAEHLAGGGSEADKVLHTF